MEKRLSLFREKLLQREISAALITDEKNIAYLCNYRFEDGFLLITESEAYIVTDFRYKEEAERTALSCFAVVTPTDKIAFVADALKNASASSLGYESRSMTVAQYHQYQGLSLLLVPMGDILQQMRAEKSEEEIDAIKTAQAISEKSYLHLLSILRPDMTETDISTELAYFMQKNGAQGKSFDIIVASGSASALPHAKCRNLPISRGFLTLDFGCIYRGYCSDTTRTLSVGKANDEMKRIYSTVLQAQEAAIAFIKEGVLCSEADACARGVITRAGYGNAFGHSLGHGVGLDVHELPSLSPRATETVLKAGNIVTVEPGIYLEGKFGCRIEDMGLVTKSGFENFTKINKELTELFI